MQPGSLGDVEFEVSEPSSSTPRGPASSTLSGTFKVSLGDIIAETVSLVNHVHKDVEAGGDTSGPPDGGSGGNGDGPGGEELTPEEEDARREEIFKNLTDTKDKLILCLPEIAAAEYGRANERDRIGWAYFQGFITRWLHGKAYSIKDKHDNGGQPPSFVDWNWLISYERFQQAAGKMIQHKYIFSETAKGKLSSLIEEDHLFDKGEQTFDYIQLEWNDQRRHAFQSFPMNVMGLVSVAPPMPDGLQTAVANVAILALASGKLRKDSDGIKRIIVERVAFFIHDGFDFNGEQPLGRWTCNETEKLFDYPFGTELTNVDFRNFREHTDYGCDFRIMSKPMVVWTGEFEYVVQ